jgi:hypothetical protein
MQSILARWLAFARRDAVPLASLFVAACALGLTVYQARSTDYQNRLSVVPQLEFTEEAPLSGHSVEVYIENNGLGPARITGMEANVGNDFTRFKSELDWSALSKKLDAIGIATDDVEASTLPINAYIRAQQKLLLLRIPVGSTAERAAVRESLRNLNLNFCYCSLYGDCFDVAQQSGETNEGSCRFDGTIKIFGRYIRLQSPLSNRLDPSVTQGR